MTPLRAPSIVEQLLGGEEYRYSFFQAVRLVDLLFARATEQRVGRGLAPQDEPLRFQARASLAFPASELYALGYDPEDRQQFDRQRRVPLSPAWRNPQTPLPITTNFFGLFGPQGVLPLHYSEFVFQRLRLRDGAVRDFLDMLGQRLASFFYRAWSKHHIVVDFEWQSRQATTADRASQPSKVDDYLRYLLSLVGIGENDLRSRLSVRDQSLAYYAGLFAQGRRPQGSLARLLADYFSLPAEQVRVQEFVPQRLPLPASEQSQLGDANCDLGISTVIGDEVLLENAKFEVVLGPFSARQFRYFLPPQQNQSSGESFLQLVHLTRFYVGLELDFDVRLLLRRDAAFLCSLDDNEETRAVLGIAAWLINDRPKTDLDDSLFPSTMVPWVQPPRPAAALH
ncbi:MAG TPA: type VI secretion system baseplate subunit TssG [Pseudomonadota bacterium]|nr:type VI secretion system baseplate subunit TssG [Pseudomonadota bacterium]